ncbi:hypothetical protein MFIFM68171_09492 [Madurella fahalii]|uniref:Uncharacterized protein n=1 Tax=Madurella fahalii TaxID=1157608 RepID=A0ABQ0GND8_9PEZI
MDTPTEADPRLENAFQAASSKRDEITTLIASLQALERELSALASSPAFTTTSTTTSTVTGHSSTRYHQSSPHHAGGGIPSSASLLAAFFSRKRHAFVLVVALALALLASPRKYRAILRHWLVTVALDPFAGSLAPPPPVPHAFRPPPRARGVSAWGATLAALREEPTAAYRAAAGFGLAYLAVFALGGLVPWAVVEAAAAWLWLGLRVYWFGVVCCTAAKVAVWLARVAFPGSVAVGREVGIQLAKQWWAFLVRYRKPIFWATAAWIVASLVRATPMDWIAEGMSRWMLLQTAEAAYIAGDILRDMAWWLAQNYF